MISGGGRRERSRAWNGETRGTRLQTWRFGKSVGEDQFGNLYYEGGTDSEGRTRRWVIYNGVSEASGIPPGWHGWMHHRVDTPPARESYQPREWQKPRIQNLTGTASLSAEGVGADQRSGRASPATTTQRPAAEALFSPQFAGSSSKLVRRPPAGARFANAIKTFSTRMIETDWPAPPCRRPVTASSAFAEQISNPVAEFTGIDKITGRIITFDVYVNETAVRRAAGDAARFYSRAEENEDGFLRRGRRDHARERSAASSPAGCLPRATA